jgi:hypothetical protein
MTDFLLFEDLIEIEKIHIWESNRSVEILNTETKVEKIHIWGSNRSVDRSEYHSQHDSSWWIYLNVWWMEV